MKENKHKTNSVSSVLITKENGFSLSPKVQDEQISNKKLKFNKNIYFSAKEYMGWKTQVETKLSSYINSIQTRHNKGIDYKMKMADNLNLNTINSKISKHPKKSSSSNISNILSSPSLSMPNSNMNKNYSSYRRHSSYFSHERSGFTQFNSINFKANKFVKNFDIFKKLLINKTKNKISKNNFQSNAKNKQSHIEKTMSQKKIGDIYEYNHNDERKEKNLKNPTIL